MPNYQHAKVYKIVCRKKGKVYVGSTTCRLLCMRIGEHYVQYRAYIKDSSKQYVSSFEVLAGGDCYIELIEALPQCKDKLELVKCERKYYSMLNCVNKRTPYQSETERK